MAATEDPALLAGKRLVIIGGTAGLGLSAAKAFIAAGARVVGIGLASDEADGLEAGTKTFLSLLYGEATEPETAAKAIEHCIAQFGGFDGLYHVAGGSGRRWGDGPLHELTDEGWRRTLDLNMTSVFYSNR